jgi:hypothetical protein
MKQMTGFFVMFCLVVFGIGFIASSGNNSYERGIVTNVKIQPDQFFVKKDFVVYGTNGESYFEASHLEYDDKDFTVTLVTKDGEGKKISTHIIDVSLKDYPYYKDILENGDNKMVVIDEFLKDPIETLKLNVKNWERLQGWRKGRGFLVERS